MNTGKAIYTILTTNTAVNTAVTGRIYPNRIPQSVGTPVIVYTFVSVMPTITKDNQRKFDTQRLQISVIAEEYSTVNEIAEKVIAALNNYKGTISEVNIDHIVYDNEVDLFDDESEMNMKAIDFKIIVKN